ncbi:kinase-like domain-containing protein [Mycotypha africana]|uniref:kinase-like domain-containing protein n=1 Tax=Mycotypha africana TaxID=64632 RepID=UPI0023006A5D|nr:kinase-like domain-containing protein [Mycotypha africana]KAI8979157.1 kinase-like domain-containing protein [Mycotypha africana]
MSNELLLRLFTSEFFNCWIAVSYLFRYSNNVGIQHYLCTELRRFPIPEIEFFLPQLIHLLITRPSESVALEHFLAEMSEKSTHMALMTLWYLQAYVSDLSANPSTASFQLCKRLLNRTQTILFAEEMGDTYNKIRENVFPTLVGMGAMLLGIGQPILTKSAGRIAIAQGRRLPTNNAPSSTSPALSYKSTSTSTLSTAPSVASSSSTSASRSSRRSSTTSSLSLSSVDMEEKDVQKKPSCSHRMSDSDPQQEHRSLQRHTSYTGSLLRSNYFRSEIQFVLALVDIATRLIIVPKEARMSALQAELTLLNHNLPAEICLPLWCPCTTRGGTSVTCSDSIPLASNSGHDCGLGHHRIVRISPSDAVVLNSAERAPYLLMIEVLEEDQEKENNGGCKDGESLMQSEDGQTNGTLHVNLNPVEQPRKDEFAERMRTAAVMLAQLPNDKKHDPIRQKIIKEMMAFEHQRMAKMETEGQDKAVVTWAVNKEDPSAAVLSENWEAKKERLRLASPYGHLPNWRLISVIVKNGADLRQEQFAIQLIKEMQRIWEDIGVDVWVKNYRVLVTSDSSGLIETLRNTISIHSLKKEAYRQGWYEQHKGAVYTLSDYFEKQWGPAESDEFIKAQDAFMRSLAGYSIACYLLQIKDRHNGNLLIDDAGHLIHIDFGFMLSNSPGSVGFEMAPFKLPQEYIDILGGVHGEKFAEYKALMKAAFLAVRKHSENILLLTEMMCKDSKLPCFLNGDLTVPQLRDRFQLQLTEPQAEEFVDRLIMSSCCNVFTRLYDTFQYYSQVTKEMIRARL